MATPHSLKWKSLLLLLPSIFESAEAASLFAEKRAALANPANPAPGWSYLGCYTDSGNPRALGGINQAGATNSVESCIAFCQSKGFVLAGGEYSQECWCGNSITTTKNADTSCNMACSGNGTEACGGPNLLSVYKSNAAPPPSCSGSTPSVTTYTTANGTVFTLECGTDRAGADIGNTNPGSFTGCMASCDNTPGCVDVSWAAPNGPCYLKNSFAGNANQNANIWGAKLSVKGTGPVSSSSAVSTTAPVSAVQSTSSPLVTPSAASSAVVSSAQASTAVVSSVAPSSAAQTPATTAIVSATNSSTAVQTTSSTIPISVVANSTSSAVVTPASNTTSSAAAASSSAFVGWTALGCYTDGVNGRTLMNAGAVNGAMTQEKCQAACKAGNYNLAGVEYAGECYCDNQLRNGGGPAPDGNANCNMACNGNSTQICGGPNRLTMFSYSNGSPVVSSSVSSAAAASSTSAAPVASISGWSYKGCYVDNKYGRIMANQQPDSNTLTNEACIQTCAKQGYSVAGTQYSSQCFCSNFLQNSASLTSDSDCSMPCSGNSTQKCGAGNRDSIWSNLTTIPSYGVPTAQNTSLPGSWKYQGCLIDNVNQVRVFPNQIILSKNNTATNCLTQCSTYGYDAGGMEYGDQCFCGSKSDVLAAKATLAPESDCSFPCTGNVTTLCGAGNRISYYTWENSTNPLYVWNYPQGNSAGSYEFFMGSVVIPLVATPMRNGKISFVEKSGTGPPNSTGAYELDPTLSNNITAAFRAQHVKTDVFCSASLMLPDRAGRILNIGGWSLTSTFGVRTLWPDAKPGVTGKNDWQENASELSLQNGRWYPSAMVMGNGSVLVAGGEGGSNGVPIPTLELLPKVGPVVYADYLNRTDPNNLYPFLAQLPSGDIFISYYNEARILDAKTLQPKRELPNIPGAVNNFMSGRSYPFEGTAMLMPQVAPYTDPLRILICGGSSPGGQALDNCVSIAPDDPTSQWQIERMPTTRVIGCMTALPDGTYLINNGAKQGTAGFGLGVDPNMNALLYDPSKPVNQRISIMANTTIGRLYHSESVLMDDGRVLVSGSDPEDPRYPQEYRLEVFNPPYMLNSKNSTRPSFSITNLDWAYGQQVSFTVNNGNTAGLKVSLLGGVSSTHGNSMGQRTYFPAVTCTGQTCTVTAPPNSSICPPSWFQMFVVDANGIPSKATWIRVGGDPGSLGNWPNFPDFDVPGMGAVIAPGAIGTDKTPALAGGNYTTMSRRWDRQQIEELAL
ncbi:hypothetical protein HDK90DRAFT_467432 [Phyllosticta capitalensis]|uniref:WSC domain-containing protein n=2 Tax=Phyllosticta capitalensis TaxID=121624 RepID=A0ABR1YKF4_9PEZI